MYQNRDLVLVTKNNYPMVAVGTKLFNIDGSLNILPGQLGIFNASNHTAIDNFTNVRNIYIAVGHDTNGDGIAEEIRKSELFGCAGLAATGQGPSSECPEIWDFLFDCTTCEAEYAIKVQVDSTETAPMFATNHLPTYPFHVITDCCGCDTCTTEHNCNEIVCKIIDQVNQTNNDGASLLVNRDYEFYVERLYSTIYSAVIPCIDQPCGGTALQGVGSVTINGVVYTIPNAMPTMLLGQVKMLQMYLNEILTNNGLQGKFHVYQKCSNTCYVIDYNGCEVLNAITLVDGTELVITIENPLTVKVPTNCKDCADADTTSKTYSCGIRFIGKMFPQECGCFPPKEYTRSRSTQLRVFPQSGFDCSNWLTRKVQDVKLSEGQGVDLRWKQYKAEVGGQGLAYLPDITRHGRLGVGIGRLSESVTAECVPYCQYNFRNRPNSYNEYGTAQPYYTTIDTLVAIPSGDTTTKAQFETTINSWIQELSCPIPTITCDEII